LRTCGRLFEVVEEEADVSRQQQRLSDQFSVNQFSGFSEKGFGRPASLPRDTGCRSEGNKNWKTVYT
jgi:hypothetical protein